MQTKTLQARYEAAAAAIKDAEARNMSQSTVNRRYREFFKIEDECKASGAL
jgi:hypothetical protein